MLLCYCFLYLVVAVRDREELLEVDEGIYGVLAILRFVDR